MQRWLLVGFLCSVFWLFLEPHLYSLCMWIRYTLILGLRLEKPPVSEDGEALRMAVTGFIAALILFLWPFYIIATVTRFAVIFMGPVKTRPV